MPQKKKIKEQNMKQYSTLGAEKWIKMQPILEFLKNEKEKKEPKLDKLSIDREEREKKSTSEQE